MSVFSDLHAVLDVARMAEADRRTIAGGISGAVLMENAGAAVTDAIVRRWSPRPVAVLCGPGNNGGDGFVVARRLRNAGWPVNLSLLGDVENLTGDAALMAARWGDAVQPLDAQSTNGAGLVVDAVFGAGLSRDVSGPAAAALAGISAPSVAIDVPSGIDGDSGAVRGMAPRAACTVTFCRAKPGHLLMPGRDHCGELIVADIGIPDAVVAGLGPSMFRNTPAAWPHGYPWAQVGAHKYARGHLVVAGGGVAASGASRLAARAGLRAGAGLVTLAVPPGAVMVYACHLTSVMLRPDPDAASFAQLTGDGRVSAMILGPGQGVGEGTRARVLAALESGKPVVLDADALTSFAETPDVLFDALHAGCILTPHEGEFTRLFKVGGSRIERARQAAARTGATVILKGPDTLIALSDGTIVINDNAPPELATAGSGDVLAGLAGGLLAQGVAAPVAAAMAVWLHGQCGQQYGPGLIAEDLPEALPAVLRQLRMEEA